MGTSTVIAIVVPLLVALIGVGGVVLREIVHTKKNGETISAVKNDTNKIKPQTDNIEKNTDKIKDCVIEQIVPQVEKAVNAGHQTSEGVQRLVEEMNYQKRLEQEFSKSESNQKEYLIAGISTIYEKNAALAQQVTALAKDNVMLKEKNLTIEQELAALKSEYTSLKQENRTAKTKISVLENELRNMQNAQGQGKGREKGHGLGL